MLTRLLAAALLAWPLTACAQQAASADTSTPARRTVSVSSVPVELRSADPTDLRIGKLIYRGGISVVPNDHAEEFGGLSGFKLSYTGARFFAVTDQGNWVTGTLTYGEDGNLAGIQDVGIAPIVDAEGKPLEGKRDADTEGLTFSKPFDLSAPAYLSFERNHRILRFDGPDLLHASGQPVAAPPAFASLGLNEGIEALAVLGDGRLVAIAEQGPANDNADSPAWVIDPAKGTWVSFTVKRNPPYAITDATLLPDGRLLTLERRFSPLTGPGAQMRVFDPANFTEGATVDGALIATLFAGVTVDNMEGVAARKTDDGKTLITIVSDDNFQRPLQRTLIMMFELAE